MVDLMGVEMKIIITRIVITTGYNNATQYVGAATYTALKRKRKKKKKIDNNSDKSRQLFASLVFIYMLIIKKKIISGKQNFGLIFKKVFFW